MKLQTVSIKNQKCSRGQITESFISWLILNTAGPGIESRWGEIFRTIPDRP